MNRLLECREYTEKYWKKERAHRIRVADEVCRNYFLFDLPWDMERTYEPVVFQQEIRWDFQPGEDPEFIYQMNRHRYFICLGQAYTLTGNEKYAEGFVRLLTDWIKRVPLNAEAEQTTWRTLEAGLRGSSWTKAFAMMRESAAVTEKTEELYREALRVHGDYLLDRFNGFKISSNWGVLESQGLYLIGRALNREDYCRTALERLSLNAGIQILPDGVHWEQSSMYHNEVLACYLEVLGQQYREKLPAAKEIVDAAEKLALADLFWKKPDHTQPPFGDSDCTDIRDILTHSALLLEYGGRPETAALLKAGGYDRLDFEGCFEYGMQAVEEYEKIKGRRPEQKNAFLQDSGNYFVRSGWEENADYLHFRNGSHGGGHGHTDKLHVSMVWNGEDVLVDAGRYCYVYHEDRIWFKGASAHNTILVDGQDYVTYEDSWTTRCGMPEWRMMPQQKDGIVLLEGAHAGYFRNTGEEKNGGVLLDRKVLVLEQGLVVLLDTAVSDREHTYQRMFHFLQQDGLRLTEQGIFYRGQKSEGSIWIDSCSKKKAIASRISSHYNKCNDNVCLMAESRGKGVTVMAAVFSKAGMISGNPVLHPFALHVEEQQVYTRVQDKVLESSVARGWHIQRGDKSFDIILRLTDTAAEGILLQSGGCLGIGRVMVCQNGQDTTVFF